MISFFSRLCDTGFSCKDSIYRVMESWKIYASVMVTCLDVLTCVPLVYTIAQYLMRKCDEKDRKLDEKDRKLDKMQSEIIHLNNNVKDFEHTQVSQSLIFL